MDFLVVGDVIARRFWLKFGFRCFDREVKFGSEVLGFKLKMAMEFGDDL
jgi:hypothetical protein